MTDILYALIPPILLISSYFLNSLNIKKRLIFTICAVAFTGWLIYFYHPIYSAYYSPAFGGSAKALDLGIYGNKGEYFANAARYLNEKEGKVYTWVPHNHNSFVYYFEGNFEMNFTDKTEYMVISVNHKNEVPDSCKTLEKGFGPGNFNSVLIYKCNEMD